jgi:hypothetical protein
MTDNPMGFTSKELLDSAKDHDNAAAIGLAAGPNIKYVRVHQRCAWAMRIVARQLEESAL